MKRTLRNILLSGILILTACASSPKTHFLSLEPAAETTQRHRVHGPAVTIGKVELPSELDRPGLVVRTGSNEIEIRDTEQWAGPLDTMVRDTLAFDLSSRLTAHSVFLPGQTAPKGKVRPITVVIERFSAGPDDRVTLWARWSLYSLNGQTRLLEDNENIEVPVQSQSGQDIAQGMSQALAELAKRIATKLQGT
jgi:uncharacterized lipoprotein YmbA